MYKTYTPLDISLDLFYCNNFDIHLGAEYEHKFGFNIIKVEEGLYHLAFKHSFHLTQNGEMRTYIYTSVLFEVKESRPSMNTCLQVAILMLEYTRAYFSIETKKVLNRMLTMALVPQEYLRSRLQTELDKLH